MSRFNFILLFLLFSFSVYAEDIKQYEFAGSFYLKDKEQLKTQINNYLTAANLPSLKNRDIKLIITPHAGYIYSGPVAAYSYKAVENKKYTRVILLGPSHHYYFKGITIYPQGYFSTPLGNLEIDADWVKKFSHLEFAQFNKKYFWGEHSLEVQLPFVIETLKKVKIVPVLFGYLSYEEMRELGIFLSTHIDNNTLIITSTDLSHYHPYQEARKKDFRTIKFIKEKDPYSLWVDEQLGLEPACGIFPLITSLIFAKDRDLGVEILKYANSGDTAQDKQKVVGYVSAIFYKKENTKLKNNKGGDMEEFNLSNEDKKTLLKIARETLIVYLKSGGKKEFKEPLSASLLEKRGAFVTLKKEGNLRGCIGRIISDEPLYKTVRDMSIASATEDPRFSPVQLEELKDIEIEISVLTPFSEVKDLSRIEVGRDGLLIRKGFYSGLLLPQVPGEFGWDREEFLKHLCLKAGLPPDAYKDKDALIYKFQAIVFSESEFK